MKPYSSELRQLSEQGLRGLRVNYAYVLVTSPLLAGKRVTWLQALCYRQQSLLQLKGRFSWQKQWILHLCFLAAWYLSFSDWRPDMLNAKKENLGLRRSTWIQQVTNIPKSEFSPLASHIICWANFRRPSANWMRWSPRMPSRKTAQENTLRGTPGNWNRKRTHAQILIMVTLKSISCI